MFEFVKATLDLITLLVEIRAEDRRLETIGHGANIYPGAAICVPFTKGIGEDGAGLPSRPALLTLNQ